MLTINKLQDNYALLTFRINITAINSYYLKRRRGEKDNSNPAPLNIVN